MSASRKQKLLNLGPEVLVDALLDLAVYSETADGLVERLIATPTESVQRFKYKLSSLRKSGDFVSWKAALGFARELCALLDDLKAGVTDPCTGVSLVAEFYEADESILNSCDDSSGYVGDVFRVDANELFWKYADRCPDKEVVANILLELNLKDDFGVRDILVGSAGKFLPESVIRSMISVFQKRADDEKEAFSRRHHLGLIEVLARQIKDAELFEKTRIASWGELSTAAYVDIARVYLECGNVEVAHSWLKKIPEGENFKGYEREQLLAEIFRKQGNTKQLIELLYQKFRSYHSVETLQELLDVMGNDNRGEVVAAEVQNILQNSEFLDSDAEFLISIGKIDDAEEYLLKRASQLDGQFYGSLLSLAESMEAENRYLVASLLYRSLLISILERGYSKAYSHGVRYLKKIDLLGGIISDWKGFDPHNIFKDIIRQAHGRKYSFWSKYEVKK
ncbi:lipopolysaccharide assembly protein LapB [Maridesulfovibrio ferrireducens]|uniref:tetratricopeptide repeat protein n=1 Tax=Maridesulfovibrio ferrireducens TaxID=246191 RepID=UPI001A2BEDC5|nr:DUF6880 family protein [Maridesulfovibrio ferrireducens]MBI9113344.1 hypothetical protein [Maridesulfovibrio ferrireducens]